MIDKKNARVASVLLVGRENALPAKYLARLLGFSDVRTLQLEIERERAAGIPILSHVTGGYYMPGTVEEAAEFCRTLERRATKTIRAADTARRWMDEQIGQQRLF